MTYYIKNGNSFRVTNENAIDIKHSLPAANYIVKEDQFGNLFLEVVDEFPELKKYYGDTIRNSDRIINTYRDRSSSTGCMFTGEKGSGKSLLAKKISIDCKKLGIPTLIINTPYVGDKFNELIQQIDQECVVLFDEFEKIYNEKQQEEVLTLFDGVFPSKKLFIIACNDKWRVNSHMKNRPGRIFYSLEYGGLEKQFIIDYCNDNLLDKDQIDAVCAVSFLFSKFNFDMLKALVEDMNRYGETPQEVLSILNAKPEYENQVDIYEFESLMVDGNIIDKKHFYEYTMGGNPLIKRNFQVEYKNEDEDEYNVIEFKQSDLVSFDINVGKFVYKTEDGDVVNISKKKEDKHDIFKFLNKDTIV